MTTPSAVGWAPEPQTRGTMGLLWSCLATIFLCTWNAIHPNLPAKDEGPWRIFARRVLYMLFALVAPELMCLLALDERLFTQNVQAKSPGWSLAQSFFLTMGGFIVRYNDETTMLDPDDVLKLFEMDALSWPDPSLQSDILDRSKADWILKCLALAQVTWFIVQIIGRAAQQLPVTTLELFALGIISCTIVTYAAWWAKPFDVRRPVVLDLQKPLPTYMKPAQRTGLLTSTGASSNMPTMLAMCMTLVFGALHIVGWQFYFPTELERWFWRASSIVCVVLPLLAMALSYYDIEKMMDNIWFRTVLIGLYIVGRMYMMVEMFISLRRVPVDVYRTPQWSQYFPSFG